MGTLALAGAAPVVTFLVPNAAEGVAAFAGAWVLVGRSLLAMAERRQLLLAVTMQEQFDTELFDLPWNEALAGHRLAAEDIADAARHVADDTALRDWYAETKEAPWPLDVLLCQRSSAVWGRRSHTDYALFLSVLTGAWFLVTIAMGLIANVSLGGYLIRLFLPSQPAFLDALDLIREHRRLAAKKHDIEILTDALWSAGCDEPARIQVEHCRNIQDLSYQLRRDGPQIPQWFYRRHRERDQRAMTVGVDRLLSQLPESNR